MKSLRDLSDVLLLAQMQSEKITCAQILTFIEVGLKEGQKMSYYVDKTGFNKSTVSRHLMEIGLEVNENNVANYKLLGWVKSVDHKKDGRAKQYFLTKKGKAMLRMFEALINT